jgi:hypothetical protein
MNSAVIRRARIARVLGATLMLVGLAAIFWLLARSVSPSPVAETLIPLRRIAWLPASSISALIFSLPSLALMWLGATLITRQKEVLEANRRETQDRLRRVREYGSDGRIEPFIGSRFTLDADEDPR